MRIAVLLKDRCQPKKCSDECFKYCPKVRTGDETIVKGELGRPKISEELCVGCGICIHKCPFEAIKIIGLPEDLKEDIVHQFGKNGFRLFRLPTPQKGIVIGILGPNGIGKTTAINILAGITIPNIGRYNKRVTWDDVLPKFAGTELYSYLEKIANKEVKTALKPQYVDKIPQEAKGDVKTLLKKVDENENIDKVSDDLYLKEILNRDIKTLSGGELQRVAIAATMLKDADIYFFDEPSSYLDIFQRLKTALVIRALAEKRQVVIIEHDLAVLDFLADNLYLMYGSEGAYGVFAHPRVARNAVNTYLSGFLKEENIRFRDWEIKFEARPPRKEWETGKLLEFNNLKKEYEEFKLETGKGNIHVGEVVGVVGPNATGKTTFVKMLAGVEKPTVGKVAAKIKVSYKPQYIKTEYDGVVRELFSSTIKQKFESSFFKAEIERGLSLKTLYEKSIDALSGGELQRVAVGLSLSQDADLYLIDEPSAYLDSNQRMETAKTIRRVMEKLGKSAMIVDHDVYFIDLVSDSIMVFGGEPSKHGFAEGPFELREGMNRFLKSVNITFRRDNDTKRPRINKLDSALDREQKAIGEYYYQSL